MTRTAGPGPGHWALPPKTAESAGRSSIKHGHHLERVKQRARHFPLMFLVSVSVNRMAEMRGRVFGSMKFLNKSLTSERL